jgi:DNA-binding IclR family transcriptional regulator
VDRALDVLLAFTAEDRELTASDLVKRVDLSRPTLYRLVHTLKRKQFLVASGDPQRFRLGPAVARLAHAWTASINLSALAEPMMRKVWEETAETVALFVRDGAFRLCVAEMPSPQVLNFKRGVGYRERLALGASGRAILAYARDAADRLETYARDVELDPKTLRQQLAPVRNRGFAISKDELIQGAVAIAAPFFDGSDLVTGSIGVFGPSARIGSLQIEAFGKLVVREARQLSSALGHTRKTPER